MAKKMKETQTPLQPKESKKLLIKGALFYDLTLDTHSGYNIAHNSSTENVFAAAAIFRSTLIQMRDSLQKDKGSKKNFSEVVKCIYQADKIIEDIGHHLLQTRNQSDYDGQNEQMPKSQMKSDPKITLLK